MINLFAGIVTFSEYVFTFLVYGMLIAMAVFNLKARNSAFNIVIILFLFVISAFRLSVGTDWNSYYEIANSIENTVYYEPFNVIIFRIGLAIGYTKLFFVVTSAIICFNLWYLTYKNPNERYLITTCFILTGFYFYGFNLIRQSTGITFYLIAIMYYQKNMNKRFFIFTIIGGMFHISILFGLVMPYLIKMFSNISRFPLFVIYLISICFRGIFVPILAKVIIYIPVFSKYASHIAVSEYSLDNISRISFVLIFLFIFGVVLLSENSFNKGAKYNKVFLIVYVGLLMYNLIPGANARFAETFMYCSVLFVPQLLTKLNNQRTSMIVLSLFGVRILFAILTSWVGITPYVFGF